MTSRTATLLRCSGLAAVLLSFTGCVPIDPSMLGGGTYGGGGGGGYYGGGPAPRPTPSYGGGGSYGGGSYGHDHDDDNFGPQSQQKGYSCGASDARSGNSCNPGRHRGEYNSRYESSFVSGYNQGYASCRPPVSSHNHGHDDDDDRNNKFGGPAAWYQSGYALGKRDRQNRESCNFERHRNHYDGRTRSEFARGYEAGYSR